ncbi:hypothetical protein SAMN05192560_1642 [Methylobacillus rhizosphaerae]|uniref:Uncharacterized protein n=1 Tax=Methylobacillus rhizosphaerae TaxID=551994 RepID=A0A239A1V8_9PROT|nr:hypothetical protein [Methylobacillus rhizosphaerae]SNR89666.1 hypothetical protein SAMN05192560_1642 [Methylobacillus rhizosphaerae]
MSAVKCLHPRRSGPDDRFERLLSGWEQAIRNGNQAYSGNQDQLALQQYQLALKQAKLMLQAFVQADIQAEPCIDKILAAYVVSHHNLSDLHLRQGDLCAAACRLCEAHQCLACMCADMEVRSELREAAQRHGRRTYKALLHFHCLYQDSSSLVERTLRICGQFCTLQTPSLH